MFPQGGEVGASCPVLVERGCRGGGDEFVTEFYIANRQCD